MIFAYPTHCRRDRPHGSPWWTSSTGPCPATWGTGSSAAHWGEAPCAAEGEPPSCWLGWLLSALWPAGDDNRNNPFWCLPPPLPQSATAHSTWWSLTRVSGLPPCRVDLSLPHRVDKDRWIHTPSNLKMENRGFSPGFCLSVCQDLAGKGKVHRAFNFLKTKLK